jgi:murein DD-endopeptidase MepM/ murein hydrolase activator NlpD
MQDRVDDRTRCLAVWMALALGLAPAPAASSPEPPEKLVATRAYARPVPRPMPRAYAPARSNMLVAANGGRDRAVVREASLEDGSRWTLLTMRFRGDPVIEATPWKASRRLLIAIKGAELPTYNRTFTSKGQLVQSADLEQITPGEVQLNMKLAAGSNVTVYRRREPGAEGTEYAVLVEHVEDLEGCELADWPVRGRLSSKFGWRVHPILHVGHMHTGIDIAVPSGTPIRVVKAGRVVWSAWRKGGGLAVIVEHPDGHQSSYMHCSKLRVHEGDQVKKNQVIALAGSTGMSTGPHVHFGVTANGKAVDPVSYLTNGKESSAIPKPARRSKAKRKPSRKPSD